MKINYFFYEIHYDLKNETIIEKNNRYYKLIPSENMHDKEMLGALIMQRISRKRALNIIAEED